MGDRRLQCQRKVDCSRNHISLIKPSLLIFFEQHGKRDVARDFEFVAAGSSQFPKPPPATVGARQKKPSVLATFDSFQGENEVQG